MIRPNFGWIRKLFQPSEPSWLSEFVPMKLIVGLGNPGKKYEKTRHNIGFEVVREIARRHASGPTQAKFKAELGNCNLGGEKVLLMCPLTYMNNSGQSVRAAFDFYKLDPNSILIVCDDFNLPLGRIRFRVKGSSGGQKGLGDIVKRLGTEEIPRMRLGIGQPPEQWDVADYVISRFAKDEQETIEHLVTRAADGAVDWVQSGTEYCMNQYNAT